MNINSELRKAAERVALKKVASGRNKWIRSSVIRNFVVDRYASATLSQIHNEAKKVFGANTPSRSAIGRFYKTINDEIQMRVA